MRMHDDQVDVPLDVVARLVAAQFPRWRALPVRPIDSHGTVNALFLLGERFVLRFPLQPSAASPAELRAEQEHARRVAPHVGLAVPEPVALGRPGPGYDGAWSVFGWIDGVSVDRAADVDGVGLAGRLAAFVRALHRIDTGGRSWAGGRGGPLAGRDDDVREHLARCADLVDAARVEETWERCLAAAPHEGPDVWVHADLMPGNLIVRDGGLAAVIDLGEGRVGDPAVDLMPAWNMLAGRARDAYRDALAVDDDAWERGRGWAVVQAVPAVAYYRESNPVMSRLAVRTLEAAWSS